LMKMCFLNQMLNPEQLAQEVKKKLNSESPAVVDFKITAPAAIKIQGGGSTTNSIAGAASSNAVTNQLAVPESTPAKAPETNKQASIPAVAQVANELPEVAITAPRAAGLPPEATNTIEEGGSSAAEPNDTSSYKVPASASQTSKGAKTLPGGMIKVGKNLAGIKTAAVQVEEGEINPAETVEFNESLSFAEAWQRVLADIQAARKDYLFSILNEANPVLDEAQRFQIRIHSEAQKQIFDPEKQALLEKIRRLTGNFYIDFEYVILEKEAESIKLVTSHDKFGRMVEKNPHLLTFVNAFGLDIDY